MRLILMVLLSVAGVRCYAQFSAGVQGTVQDASSAVIPAASITLVNTATQVAQAATTNDAGMFRINSLPPGSYTVKAEKAGFETKALSFNVGTGELRNVQITMTVGTTATNVIVTTQAPLVDTSDSRSQLTLSSQELESLPNSNLSPLAALSLAPGVTGGASGSNYSPQNFTTISAGGRGQNGNSITLDGISVTDSTRPGVVNLTPNLDAVQEIAIQPNTYSVQSSSSSIQIAMTTKSGTDNYHGSASAYYQYQGLNARGEYGIPQPIAVPKNHTTNLSFTFGGPVPKVKQLFFFAAYNPFLQISPASTSTTTIVSPAFIKTYMTNGGNPSPVVRQMLQAYNQPSSTFVLLDQSSPANFRTAAQAFNNGSCPASGFLGPNYFNVGCGVIVNQLGLLNANGTTNAKQYSIRVDKNFTSNRIYVSFFRSTLHSTTPSVLPASATFADNYQYALQGTYTHTFSSNLLNDVTAGITRAQGLYNRGNYYFNPNIAITGFGNNGNGGFSYGKSGGQNGNYVILNERYRDLLTYIHGAHSITVGGEIAHTTDPFISPTTKGIPSFTFNNPLNAANGLPDGESGLNYNFVTGAPQPFQYNFATTIFAIFAEDSWKASRRLTLNYGIRYDNYGNPYPIVANGPVVTNTTLSTIRLSGTGSFQSQIADASLVPGDHAFAQRMNWNFSPRAGFAYDLLGNGRTVIRGGFGLYRDWFNLGNATNKAAGNLPISFQPTFTSGVTAVQPLFSVGTGNVYPFGYTYPTIPSQSLDSHGGIPGTFPSVGSADRNLKSPSTLNWNFGMEKQFFSALTASVEYRGSHSYNQIYGGATQGGDQPNVDTNLYNGDTISHPVFRNGGWNKGAQLRLNPSFGQILYSFNGARGNYQGVTVGVRGRFGRRGFLSASYTHGHANDNWSPYYNAYQADGSWNADRQYAPSPLDVRNRLSLAAAYQLPGLHRGWGFAQRLMSGFQISSTVRLETGTPFTVVNRNALNVIDTVSGTQLTSANYATELAAGNITYITPDNINSPNVQAAIKAGSLASSGISGDYLGDGNNTGIPNVNSYAQRRDRKTYKYKCAVALTGCSGSILASQFSAPAFRTQGAETFGQFRNPGFQNVDMSLQKETALWRETSLRLRIDFFNAFNRVNWNTLDNNWANYATTFGTTQSTNGAARVGQLSAKFTF